MVTPWTGDRRLWPPAGRLLPAWCADRASRAPHDVKRPVDALELPFGESNHPGTGAPAARVQEKSRNADRQGARDSDQRIEADVHLAPLDLADELAGFPCQLGEPLLAEAPLEPELPDISAHRYAGGTRLIAHDARLLGNAAQVTTPYMS